MLRRAILLITGTATAVTGVLAYHPPQLASVATDSLPVTPTPTATEAKPSPTVPGAKNPGTKPPGTQAPIAPPQNNLPSGVFAGNTTNTRWGPVQVEITVKNGVITAANALAFPDGDRRSLSISQQAIPYLIEQTLGVIKSSEVMGVSGASYTSNGWRTSLQSAIKKAGI